MSTLALSFCDEGASDQLPVVFLHAFPYHSGMWEGQRRALRGQARFLSLDARGVGPHAIPAPAYLLEHLVDDLLALLDQRSIRSAVLCGLSLGGYIALRAVERAPERVRGLVLADTQAAGDSDEAKRVRAQALRMLWRDGLAVFGEAQLNRQLSPHTLAERPDLVAHARTLIADSRPEGLAAAMVAIATRTDLRAALPKIAVPTRVLVGGDDTITPPATARSLAESIPGADVHVLARAGHLSNLEAEEPFNHLLLQHLARVRGTP